jgi:hypothetical protein
MSRIDIIAYLIGAVGCAAVAAYAGPCDVVNKSDTPVELKTAGKLFQLAGNAWAPLPDCADLEVLQGSLLIRGLVAGVPVKKVCEKGSCTLPPASKSLIVSSTSSYKLVPGGHRMDKDLVRKAGIPKGRIYGLAAAAKFDFTSLPGTAVAFALAEAKGKKPVFTARVTDGGVLIPVDLLKRGTKYAWEVYGAGNQKLASGGFDILSEEDASVVAQDLGKTEQTGERPVAEKLLDELGVFYTHDLTYEIETLRQTLASAQ